jgi:hypothetical protein
MTDRMGTLQEEEEKKLTWDKSHMDLTLGLKQRLERRGHGSIATAHIAQPYVY